MYYVLISLLALFSGVALAVIGSKRYWSDLITDGLSVLLMLYGSMSLLALVFHDKKSDDMERYDRAVSEYHVMLDVRDMDYAMFNEYAKDIMSVNKLIDESKKYHDHWYLGPFYYEKVGDLDKIQIDSMTVKLKF